MMGGFFIRVTKEITLIELYELIKRAKEKVFKVVDSNVYWFLVGSHWLAVVMIYTVQNTEHVDYINSECLEDDSCLDKPVYISPPWCHKVDIVTYTNEVRYVCTSVRRKMNIVVEVNTNSIGQHDPFILKLVVDVLAEANFTDMLRPM
jgi:hypothetical protein